MPRSHELPRHRTRRKKEGNRGSGPSTRRAETVRGPSGDRQTCREVWLFLIVCQFVPEPMLLHPLRGTSRKRGVYPRVDGRVDVYAERETQSPHVGSFRHAGVDRRVVSPWRHRTVARTRGRRYDATKELGEHCAVVRIARSRRHRGVRALPHGDERSSASGMAVRGAKLTLLAGDRLGQRRRTCKRSVAV